MRRRSAAPVLLLSSAKATSMYERRERRGAARGAPTVGEAGLFHGGQCPLRHTRGVSGKRCTQGMAELKGETTYKLQAQIDHMS